VGLTPDLFVFYFKRGPLAWNGILAFWVEITVATVWLVVTTVMTANAIKRPDAGSGPSLEDRVAALERSRDLAP
jgi:hypothetical protein